MKTTDQADATAHALDLLPPTDPARSDPALRRNPALVEEGRATRELAADVWLSVSPLRTAPPGVLAAVMEKIGPAAGSQAGPGRRWLPWVAASGWAAAAALALVWWAWPPSGESPNGTDDKVRSAAGGNPEAVAPPNSGPRPDREVALRREIQRLQARLAKQWHEPGATGTTPRVMALRAPGGVRRSSEETRVRVNALLTEALRSALEAERGSTDDPVALVIERGWPVGGLAVPGDDGLVRHRNFPELSWRELGLLRSEAGEYYDPANSLIWSADPRGRGFLGRQRMAADDLAGFSAEPTPDGAADSGLAVSSPEGFLIEDPLTGTTQVILDQLPAPLAGTDTVVRWTAAGGPQAASLDSLLAMNATSAAAGTLVLTLPNSSGMTSFQVLAVPTDTGPARVIVASDP
jgi:hypothetical protein